MWFYFFHPISIEVGSCGAAENGTPITPSLPRKTVGTNRCSVSLRRFQHRVSTVGGDVSETTRSEAAPDSASDAE